MPRPDDGLAFMLKYENVACYQDDVVRILDRRIYPRKVEFVICKNYKEVAQDIAEMVTQSGGPWMAAQQAMAMTAYQVQDQPLERAKALLREVALSVTRARPSGWWLSCRKFLSTRKRRSIPVRRSVLPLKSSYAEAWMRGINERGRSVRMWSTCCRIRSPS